MWFADRIEWQERALRLKFTTGLDEDQLDELVARVEGLLEEPWDRPRGRKKKLSLRDAVAVTVAYVRQNMIQEVLGEMWDVSQPNISDKITYLTPLVAKVVQEFVPSAAEAKQMVPGRVCLVDGSLGPCWSWRGHRELWAGKHKTTGHNFQVITNLWGEVLFVSDPLPGSVHDATAITQTPVAEILKYSGGVIADKGYQVRDTAEETERRRTQHRRQEGERECVTVACAG